MKKLLAFVLTAVMLLAFAACGEKEPTGTSDISGGDVTNVPQDFKVGVILIGDETEGYTLAHMNGIKAAAQALGLAEDQIIWKYKVEENAACKDAGRGIGRRRLQNYLLQQLRSSDVYGAGRRGI